MLFESFLPRRNLTVLPYEPVVCGKCRQTLDRALGRQRLKEGKTFAFCNDCGERLALAKEEPIQLTREEQTQVDAQRLKAEQRTRFEQAIFRVQAYVTEQGIKAPECFISYALGEREHERWVEKSLATDLQKAGIAVVLDRRENAKIGASVSRFVERIDKADRVVVGTPAYRKKYENKDTTTGCVAAAEVDLISNRLLGTEEQKESVLPMLLAGEKTSALPPLLHGPLSRRLSPRRRLLLHRLPPHPEPLQPPTALSRGGRSRCVAPFPVRPSLRAAKIGEVSKRGNVFDDQGKRGRCSSFAEPRPAAPPLRDPTPLQCYRNAG